MDPCNLHPGEAAIVAARLVEELDRALASNEIIATSVSERRARRFRARLAWPD
jgi:L-seryl-tRNA(Ser) seleniumtransferase